MFQRVLLNMKNPRIFSGDALINHVRFILRQQEAPAVKTSMGSPQPAINGAATCL
jgi:hypothetical protein